MKRNIIIIPAKGTSQRIKKKNIKLFNGVPILGKTINKLNKIKQIDKIYVSTDDLEVKSIAEASGAEVPFLRDKKLADSHTTTHRVIKSFIENLDLNLRDSDNILCVYPCTPLLKESHILQMLERLNDNISKYVYPAVSYSHPIQRSFKISDDNSPIFLKPSEVNTRTQDCEKYYHDAGQVYMATKKTWITSNKIHENASIFYYPAYTFIDIDNEKDWLIAEKLTP